MKTILSTGHSEPQSGEESKNFKGCPLQKRNSSLPWISQNESLHSNEAYSSQAIISSKLLNLGKHYLITTDTARLGAFDRSDHFLKFEIVDRCAHYLEKIDIKNLHCVF